MKILVIGGTQFVGRHFAVAALRAGHEVTLFHRGSKGIGSIPGAEDVLGDRTQDLARVAGKSWDVVMDSSAYLPGVLRQSVQALSQTCGRYVFVSTISVYERSNPPIREDSPKMPIGDPDTQEVNGDTYGYLKVLCEQEVSSVFGDRSLLIRPGIVAGSFDPTNRFTHWVERFAGGGKVLVPNVPNSRLQLIDARDLAEFMVLGAEKGLNGSFNVAGPPSTFGEMIATCKATNPDSEIVWADEDWLEAQGVSFGKDLPLATTPGDDILFAASSDAAIKEGLTYRTLGDTAQDVLHWKSSLKDEAPPKVGIALERELEVIGRLALGG